MKKIFKNLIIVLGVVVLYSCDSELNQLPNDSVTPDSYYSTISEFESATRGVYSGFLGGGYYGGSFCTRPDIMTDNVIIAPSGRLSNQLFFEWRQAPNLAWDMLTSPYIVTSRANLILANIDNIDDGSEKNNFIGEAKAARALALFDMVRVYSKLPTQSGDASGSLGMQIITGTDPTVQIPRPTVSESFDFIISELEDAKNLVNTDNGSGRFNKNAVNALLSRAYLYNGNYSACVSAANAVTASVASRATFAGVWTDASTAGVLLKIDQDRVLDGISIGTGWSQSNAGLLIPEYVTSFELSNLYQNSDVRKNAYTALLADSDGNIYNAIIKMYGEAGQNNGVVDAKVLRMAEVYLNKAEAHANSGSDALALAALDEVRMNRYTGFITGGETGAALMDAIKLERRLELFAESHRYFDLKRWGQGITRSSTDGDYFDGNGTPVGSAFLSLPADSHLFQMPIPQAEINIYSDFPQNPGY